MSRSNKLKHFYETQMLNSHEFFMYRRIATISALFIIENEINTDTLDNFEYCGVLSVGVGRSQLPVSPLNCTILAIFLALQTLNFAFSDYDLSLVCMSKCDDEYLQCVSTCSSTDCLVECNRAWGTCGDCK